MDSRHDDFNLSVNAATAVTMLIAAAEADSRKSETHLIVSIEADTFDVDADAIKSASANLVGIEKRVAKRWVENLTNKSICCKDIDVF